MNPSERYQRITGIFLAVCNLDGDERSRALESLCAECPELQSEIELLLTFHDKLTPASRKKDSDSGEAAD